MIDELLGKIIHYFEKYDINNVYLYTIDMDLEIIMSFINDMFINSPIPDYGYVLKHNLKYIKGND